MPLSSFLKFEIAPSPAEILLGTYDHHEVHPFGNSSGMLHSVTWLIAQNEQTAWNEQNAPSFLRRTLHEVVVQIDAVILALTCPILV
jgi:hypothetical protein